MSSELLTPYDPAKYLTDDEDIAVFLADAEETGDASYIARTGSGGASQGNESDEKRSLQRQRLRRPQQNQRDA